MGDISALQMRDCCKGVNLTTRKRLSGFSREDYYSIFKKVASSLSQVEIRMIREYIEKLKK
jgi:hypothetical protein